MYSQAKINYGIWIKIIYGGFFRKTLTPTTRIPSWKLNYFRILFPVYKREQQPGDRRGEASDPEADDQHDRERPQQRVLQDRRGPGEYIV